MRCSGIFLICVLVTTQWSTTSGETSYKIGQLLLKEAISNWLIPELPETLDSKFAFGRRLLQGKEADVKNIVQNEPKLEQGNSTSNFKNEKNRESSNDLIIKEVAENKVTKDVRHADGKEGVDKGERIERIVDIGVDERNQRVQAKEQGKKSINNAGTGPKITKSTSAKAMTKENQIKNEEKANIEAKQERKGATQKERREVELNEEQKKEKNDGQSAVVMQGQDEERKKKLRIKKKGQITVQQNEGQNVANGGGAVNDGKIEQIARPNLTGNKVPDNVKQKTGGALEKTDKKQKIKRGKGDLRQPDSTKEKVEQKTSQSKREKTLNKSSGGRPASGMPDSTGEDLALLGKQEVKRQDNKVETEKSKKLVEGGKEGKKVESGSSDNEEIRDMEVKDAESQAEDFKEDRPSDSVDLDVTSVGGTLSRESQEPDDEDYSDLVQEFADLPSKFQGTAEKVAEHLAPDLLKLTDTSKIYFNMANQHLTNSFSPIIGKDYAPFLASIISYALLFLPLIVVVILFEHIRALLSLQKILLFIHIYLAAYFATLILASFIIGFEPMTFFYKNSLSSYIYLQLLQALGYLVYLILQTFNVIISCSSDTFSAKLTSMLQWMVAIVIGLHYYVTIFQRAMATKAPRTSWKVYGIYSIFFFTLCLFARIKRLKKQYIHAGDGTTDKKN